MQLIIKTFDELTTLELYEILKLRSEIFIVEQNAIYQDLDDIDKTSYHVYIKNKNDILAYLRIIINNKVTLGRIVVKEKGIGLGSKLVKFAYKYIRETLNLTIIEINAQMQAKLFYEKLGFKQSSNEFILDGILHIKMETDLNNINI